MENKPKFTSGPWKVSEHEDTGEYVVRSPLTLNIVCNCEADGFGEVSERETQANAALISAAPEMYEALRMIQEAFVHKPGDEKGNKARTAPLKYCNAEFSTALNALRLALSKAEGKL